MIKIESYKSECEELYIKLFKILKDLMSEKDEENSHVKNDFQYAIIYVKNKPIKINNKKKLLYIDKRINLNNKHYEKIQIECKRLGFKINIV